MSAPIAVKIGLGLLAAGGVTALVLGNAKASEGPKQLPPELRDKIIAALKTADPPLIRKVALEVEKAGFPEQARSLEKAADAIEAAIRDVKPSPVLPPAPKEDDKPKPKPSDGTRPPAPVVRDARVVHVKKGEGPFQIAQRLKVGHPAERMKELRNLNIPFDADGLPRESDGMSGFRPILEPGDRLLVPDNWPDHPDITTEKVGVPAGVSGDDDPPVEGQALRRLAGRVALEIEHANKGSENKQLIGAFQRAHHARGDRRGACNGVYDAETALHLITCHGIAAPMRFADGKELYWPNNPRKQKERMRNVIGQIAKRDLPRREEWLQVRSNI
jgi:hypothetical protein